MHNNFYDKDKISGNVDTLMTDMTIGTVTRRRRDAEALSKIRAKQASSKNDNKEKSGLFKKIKSAILRKKKFDPANVEKEQTEYMTNSGRIYSVKRFDPVTYSSDHPEDEWDDATVVLSEDYDDSTVVIEEEKPVAAISFSNDNKTFRAIVNNAKTTIGSSSGRNDIVVDSKRISRVHAEIICRNCEMFIKDCGSTNGTYINGSRQRLPKGVEYRINIGDVIRLADIEFYIEDA